MKHTVNGLTHCVVCGRRLVPGHQCPKSVIAAHLAAERRVDDWYDPLHPSVPPDPDTPAVFTAGLEVCA